MFFQDDKQWSTLRWYDEALDAVVSALTDASHSRVDADFGLSGQESTLGQSGCWHVSAASMLSYFGEKVDNISINPKTFLEALRKSGMGTLTGYVSHLFVDPISIITKTRVQLRSYRDFGKKGAPPSSGELLELLGQVAGPNVCAIVNVSSHEFFGTGDSHYVLIHGVNKGMFVMHDPASKRSKNLFGRYEKVYQVTLYRCG